MVSAADIDVETCPGAARIASGIRYAGIAVFADLSPSRSAPAAL
jgi:hypothetical protein